VITSNENYQFLATDQIAFIGEVAINPETYLRAVIIDCNNGIAFSQRSANDPIPSYTEISDEEIQTLESKYLDSLVKNNPAFSEEYNNYRAEKNHSEFKSEVDNNAIKLYPNPSKDYFQIDMSEEDFNDVSSIEIIDMLGRKTIVNKNSTISVKELTPGLYQIKFTFTFGYIVVKNFLKE